MAQGLRDYGNPILQRVLPATSMPMPPGPAAFPIQQAQDNKTTDDLLRDLIAELKNQFTPSPGIIRAGLCQVGRPLTLDWSAMGVMNRVAIQNAGPNTCWLAFDVNGGGVDGFTSDQSWQLLSLGSLNLTLIKFYKIGIIVTAGTALIHAIAFQSPAGKSGGTAI